jgi:4-amino-4-deoxy-L-arabinose transferase-like glycosyltransferase
MTEKRLLALILIAFIALGFTYALATPAFEASDELWHYPMVRHLADGDPLPVQVFDPAEAGPWKQEASQPPLYYYLAAVLTFWIDTSDMGQIRWLNPHVDNGVITADGNINLAVHDSAANPWQGTLLAVRIIRLASVLMGAATVYLTYRIAREVEPERPEIALGAAAVNAFMPMFLFISGAVNNDNLVIPLASLAVWFMIRQVSGKNVTLSSYLLLGVVIGLAALTKISGVGLLPLALGTAFVAEWQGNGRPADIRGLARVLAKAIGRFLLVLLPVLLIAGWWYWRNIQLYGDWSGWNAFIAVLGQRAHPASLAQLWDERWGFMLAYWGLFGGVNVPMWTWIYYVLNGMGVVAVGGFVVYLLRIAYSVLLLNTEYAIRNTSPFQSLISKLLHLVVRHFALLVCLLWSAAIVVGLIQWATTTWSSQGRLVFTAVSTLTTLLVVGLVGWLPRRPAGWVVGLLAGFMFLVAAAAPFIWIWPAYQIRIEEVPGDIRIVNYNFGDNMELVGYHLEPEQVRPGQAVDVTLIWNVLAAMDRDWSVFVHLNDPVLGTPIAQRDMYPEQGLRPTRLLRPGQSVVNHYRLVVPPTAVAPAELELVVGLYDFYSGERLQIVGNAGDAAVLATLPLEPAAGQFPNPVAVNFENELELVGYQVDPRRAESGDSLELVLYWRPLRPLSADYTFFAQVVDEDTTRYASHDLAPQPATTGWTAGEVQPITMTLTLAAGTPPGVYPVIVGIYTRTADGGFDRLQIMTAEGRLTDDFLVLTQVRVVSVSSEQ